MAKHSRNQVAFIKTDSKEYPIYECVNTIGRNKDAVVNIKNINISQNHAILVVIGNKHYLSDIGSSNLTYHNGVKLVPFLMYQLANESKIKFGNVDGSYHISDKTTEKPNSSRLEMTQDMTQGFYTSETQIFQDITNLEATQKVDLNGDIHEAATQEIDLTEFKMPGKPVPRKSNEIQSQGCDVHDAPTQLFDISSVSIPHNSGTNQPSTSKTIESEKEDDQQTQPLSLDTTERIAEINDQMKNIHEECTQVADLKTCLETEKSSEQSTESLSLETRRKISEISGVQNIWDQPTQVFNLRKNASQNQESQFSEVPNLDIHENYMDDSMEMQNIFADKNSRQDVDTAPVKSTERMVDQAEGSHCQKVGASSGPDLTKETEKLSHENAVSSTETPNIPDSSTHPNIDDEDAKRQINENSADREEEEEQTNEPIDSQATNVSTTLDLGLDNDATDCEEDLEIPAEPRTTTVYDDNSNESLDFLDIDKSLNESKRTETSFKVVELEPLYGENIENDDVKGSKKEASIERDTGVRENCGSDSDDEIIKPKKRRSVKILETQEDHLDSDTDGDIVAHTDKKMDNDSDTDCSDIELKRNNPAKPLKPTQLSQNNENADDSDEGIIRPRKRKSLRILETQENHQDSDTVRSTEKTVTNQAECDSDTDCSDTELLESGPAEPSKSQPNKVVEDSYIIENDDSGNESLKGLQNKRLSLINTTLPETQASFNDSDYVPATQEVVIKSTFENRRNNSEEISTESFKLVLTQTERSEKFHTSQIPCCSKNLTPNIHNDQMSKPKDDDVYFAATQKLTTVDVEPNQVLEDDDVFFGKATVLEQHPLDTASQSSKRDNGKGGSSESMDALFLSENTQKIDSQSSEKLNKYYDEDLYMVSTQKINQQTKNYLDETDDSLYIQATQKLPETLNHKRASILDKVDEVDDSIYLQATQHIKASENVAEATQQLYGQDTQKLAPITEEFDEDGSLQEKPDTLTKSGKKFTFKKTKLKLNASLNTFLKSNSPRIKESTGKNQTEGLVSDKRLPLVLEAPDKRENVDLENCVAETDEMSSSEIPIAIEIEILPERTDRPMDPVSTVLENDAVDSAYPDSSPKSATNKVFDKSFSDMSDLEGFSKKLEDFKGVLVDKKSCVEAHDKKKSSDVEEVGSIDKVSDLAAIEKLEHQNHEMVEGILKNVEDNVVKESSKDKTKGKNTAIKTVSKRPSRRRLSSSSNQSKASDIDYAHDNSPSIPERLQGIDDFTKGKNLKLPHEASNLDEVFTTDQESNKDESSDAKSKKEHKAVKSASRRTLRRRGSNSSNKSKTAELSDTSDGEEFTKQKSVKRLESVEELPTTSKRSTRRRKASSITDNLTREETTSSKLSSEPPKKRTAKLSSTTDNQIEHELKTLKSMLEPPKKSTTELSNTTEDEVNGSKLMLQPPKKRMTGKKVRSDEDKEYDRDLLLKTMTEEVNQTANCTLNMTYMSMNSIMNQSLALLETTTSKKTHKTASFIQDNLEIKASASRKSMNLVCNERGTSDTKSHLNSAANTEMVEKKSRGGRGTRNAKTVQKFKESGSTTNTRGRKIGEKAPEKVEAATVGQNLEEKPQPEPTTSRGRRAASKRSAAESASNNPSDSGSISGDSVLSTPKKQRLQRIDSNLIHSGERNRRKQKPKVVFTMLESPQLESMIRQLGGSIVDSVEACTVLVTEHAKRTQKLLAAVGQGKPICSSSWITESKKKNEFLDPWDHILIDKEAEAKWRFSLKESIQRGSARKLLQDYTFQIMAPAADILKGAIEACGGRCVSKLPSNTSNVYVIGAPEHKTKYQRIVKQNPTVKVLQPEAIFDGVLRQELRFEQYYLT